MASGRPPGDSPVSPRRRRPSHEKESGLRDLGNQIEHQGSSGRRSIPNEDALRDLGATVDQRGSQAPGRGAGRVRRRWSLRRKILTGVASVVVLALLAVAAGYGYLRYRYDQLPKLNITAEQQTVPGQPFNILVIGSDSRVGLTGSAAAQAGSAAIVPGQRSDVIMVWHVEPATKQITVVSIPRDTVVTLPNAEQSVFGQFNKINSSFNDGANALVQTIQDNFGIPINHVIEVDFGGFVGAVNALGGVYMDLHYPAKDAYSGLNITTTGCQLLNGTEALAVARSRDYEYYADGQWTYDGTGDLGRIKRQDAFLRALIDAAKSKINPLTINAFIGSLPQGLVIDNQFGLNELIGLAEDFHSFSANSLDAMTLPTTAVLGTSLGDVLFEDQPLAQQMLYSVFGSELDQTPSTPPPDSDWVSTPPPVISSPSSSSSSSSSPTSSAPASSAPTANATPSFDPTPCTPS